MRPHNLSAADITGEHVAGLAGTSWLALDGYVRQQAAAVMVEGGTKLLLEKYSKGDLSGAIGIGGANGTNLVCSILRSLPYLVPKVMVSTVAGTAAAQWYIAESDIAMYPSIGDISLNRITTAIMENAANAVAIAAKNWVARRKTKSKTCSCALILTNFEYWVRICKTTQFGEGAGPHSHSARRVQRAQQTPGVQS